MKKFSIFLIFILSCAKSDTEKFWQDGNPLPYKVANFGWTSSLNSFYIFGGDTSFSDYSTSRMIIYNNNSYQISETLIAPIHLKNSCIATPTNYFFSYDLNSKTYQDLGNLPFNAGGCFAVVLNNKIYIIVGANTSSFYEFNPTNNSFNQKASFSWIEKKSLDNTCSVLDNNIYVFGGQTSSNTISSKVFKYDPNSDNWSYVTDMKTPRRGLGSAVIGNEIYVTNKVEIFKVSPIVF